jgi:class 3 adenylate cyclase
MSSDALFRKELEVIEKASNALSEGASLSPQDRAAFEALFGSYQKLFRTSKRLIRLSDRNERDLAAMAAKQRLAAEEIGRKNLELEALSVKLSKYLSPQVYDSIFSGRQEVRLASQRKKLTVFFSDIAGFTETTDKMESEDLTRLINHYLTEMSAVALQYGATIDKYIGDAVMIFFGDPESQGVKQDALACVKMAVAMQARMEDLASDWRAQGIEHPLRCRIGINTGYCTVGNFGSNDRMDYTILGGAVNLASRMEAKAEPGGILITYETFAHVRDELECHEADSVHVKGIAYPISTYKVIGLKSDKAQTDTPVLHAEAPHIQVTADIENMSTKEREEAAELLLNMVRRLQSEND